MDVLKKNINIFNEARQRERGIHEGKNLDVFLKTLEKYREEVLWGGEPMRSHSSAKCGPAPV
jgi:hypothetical protein